MRSNVFIAVLVFSFAAANTMAADGETRGQLVVGGRSTPLKYAYAVPQRDAGTLLIVCDEPLSNKAIQDVFERIHMADDGKLHAVEMLLDSKRTMTSVSMRHEGFKGHGGGYSSSHHYEPTVSGSGTIAGRIFTSEPGEFMEVAYSFDATFTAPIWREPAPTLGGAAAARSPQAKAALAFFKAGRARDFAALKKCVVSSRAGDFDGPQGKEMMEMFQFAPDPAKAKITRVDVAGETAEVVFESQSEGSTETSTVRLRLENGRWKVSP